MFIEERLLDCVAYGSEFGSQYNTRIKRLKSGVTRRNIEWEHPLDRCSIIYRNLDETDHGAVIAAHHVCHGAAIGFRVKNWTDFEAVNEVIGEGTGASETYQLQKTYSFGNQTYSRPIKKPVQGSVVISVDGVPAAATVDHTTGEVTINASLGAEITWTGEFDIPMTFADDYLPFTVGNRSPSTYFLTADVDLVEDRQ